MSFSLASTGLYHTGIIVLTVLSVIALVAFVFSGGTKHVPAPGIKAAK